MSNLRESFESVTLEGTPLAPLIKDYTVNNSENIQLQTFRFKMSEDLCVQLYEFSKLHQYDDRKSFKDAWYVWINTVDIESLINIEIKTMKNQGYTGDVIEKLFKSARYYYRKKKSQDSTEPVQRKPYVGVSSETLEMIDKHLKEQFEGDIKRTTEGNRSSRRGSVPNFVGYNCLRESKVADLESFTQ